MQKVKITVEIVATQESGGYEADPQSLAEDILSSVEDVHDLDEGETVLVYKLDSRVVSVEALS